MINPFFVNMIYGLRVSGHKKIPFYTTNKNVGSLLIEINILIYKCL